MCKNCECMWNDNRICMIEKEFECEVKDIESCESDLKKEFLRSVKNTND